MELGDVVTGDQKELFSRLTVSANRLSGYINNILNTSKYDRRHLQVHLAEDSIAGIYDMIRDDMALRASAQHRMISVNFKVLQTSVAVRTAGCRKGQWRNKAPKAFSAWLRAGRKRAEKSSPEKQ
jgi:signal transduction histidine kinase